MRPLTLTLRSGTRKPSSVPFALSLHPLTPSTLPAPLLNRVFDYHRLNVAACPISSSASIPSCLHRPLRLSPVFSSPSSAPNAFRSSLLPQRCLSTGTAQQRSSSRQGSSNQTKLTTDNSNTATTVDANASPPSSLSPSSSPLLPFSLSTSTSSLTTLLLHPIFGPHSTPLRVFLLFSFTLLIHVALFDIFTGHGPSMLPTFAHSGEIFLVEALSTYTLPSPSPSFLTSLLSSFFSIRAGDVVLSSNPVKADHVVAKRVIAMGGEWVRVRVEDETSGMRVPEGCVWLQGDHLAASRDSREYGPVPYEMIKGKVVAKIYPLRTAQWMERTLRYRGY